MTASQSSHTVKKTPTGRYASVTKILNHQKLKFFLCITALFALSNSALATDVYLDGKLANAYFNDGDTLRVLSGPMKGLRARLTGFNALETYGPVHVWGDWHADELFAVSNKATKVAQNGTWHCKSQKEKDRYSRSLYFCNDLAEALIKQGLAHVMLMDDSNPSGEALLKIQEAAIQAGKGIWKKGAPSFILTSAHSASEPGIHSKAYDRFVSTVNGKSIMLNHKKNYKECEVVCSWSDKFDPDPDLLRQGQDTASCMVYVPFEHRYGANAAECLE